MVLSLQPALLGVPLDAFGSGSQGDVPAVSKVPWWGVAETEPGSWG